VEDVGSLHYALTQLADRPAEGQSVFDFAIDTLDEFFDCVHFELYLAHRGQREKHARGSYLAICQRTVLQLTAHLLRYTQADQLYSTPSHSTWTDKCCRHIYRALDGLLAYTVTLAGGTIDPALPVPRSARSLLQAILLHDLDSFQARLDALQVSTQLMEIALAPFKALSRDSIVTLHTLRYLRQVKQALYQLTPHGYQSPGDYSIVQVLIAHDFNAPAFIDYCQQAFRGQYETIPQATTQALHPHLPSAREQLAKRPGQPTPDPVPPEKQPTEPTDDEDAEESDEIVSSDSFLSWISLRVLGAILYAAWKENVIQWGTDDTQLSKRVVLLRSVLGPVKAESIRRGFNNPDILAKAREVIHRILTFLDNKLAELEKRID
jgi:hypothetical protein